MLEQQTTYEFRPVGDGDKTAKTDLFYKEEIQLALRNRGMPLEGLHYDITPTGMHYLLIHFDIPVADEEAWSLEIGGLVENPVALDMSDIRSRPQVTMPVTMECAGNGRALMEPRAISQPWLLEAIGTAEWTGTPLRPILGGVVKRVCSRPSLPGVGRWPSMTPFSWHNGSPPRATA